MSEFMGCIIVFAMVIGFAVVPAIVLGQYEMDGGQLVKKSQIALRNRIRAYTEEGR